MKKRIFSGAQPTGQLHIGNYLGALKNWAAMQDEYDGIYCIVNLHAITLPQDAKTLRQKTLDLARVYLAAGIDPAKSTIFIQSDVPEHAELAWTLSCIARMGELGRMTQFKDKSAKRDADTVKRMEVALSQLKAQSSDPNTLGWDVIVPTILEHVENGTLSFLRDANVGNAERAGVGLFTYPVLMAADILLYQTDLVPVGQDQKQHLELTRDFAERFNRDFGETFTIPEPYIPKAGASIKSLQDPAKKMSKSDENAAGAIFLLDDPDTITKKIKRAVTDSGTDINFDETRPAITNLLTIYQLLTGKSSEECVAHFEGKGYGAFKTELAEATVEFLRPFQARVKDYDDATLKNILNAGAEKARSIAAGTLKTVYERMGIR
jgi:tryptophanyl-tRNA synthetase